ncbi:MAG: 2,3,4,5-tetrahydropyridine-2,6-dicarboxylate N-succinyltransferase [Bdellovibrionota bacterium]
MKKIDPIELNHLKNCIENITGNIENLKEKSSQDAVIQVLRYLEDASLRVASPQNTSANCGTVAMDGNLQEWVVHAWVKQAILFAMRMRQAKTFKTKLSGDVENNNQGRVFAGEFAYHDKFDLQNNLGQNGVRCLPGSIVREGAFVSQNAILMPSFVNIGAWIGENTMIDTWATAGSCAQIGANVHVAGGVGIGGVLEPASARPVIVGDNAFLGSRVIIVEGVVVSSGAVLGANVCLTSSTPIYDVTSAEKKEYRGFVPPNAVVAAGTRPKSFPGGEVLLQCAYIIGYRNARTDAKVSLNDVLRETGIAI